MDADLCQKDATSGSVRKGAAVNEGSRCFPAERPLVCAEVLGWARAWSTRLSPALPPDPIPADPAETFEPLQSGAPFKMCAFPTNFQAFLQTEHSGYCKTKSKSLGYPWDLLSPLWVIPAGSPDLRAALPTPSQGLGCSSSIPAGLPRDTGRRTRAVLSLRGLTPTFSTCSTSGQLFPGA